MSEYKHHPESKYKFVRINGQMVPEHRYVMEQHLGRKLAVEEVVHHINGDRADNRLENLELCENDLDHMSRFHSGENAVNGKPKGDKDSNKIQTSIRVDKDSLEEFKRYAKEDCINMSAWIEAKIKEYIERRKPNEKSKNNRRGD